MPNFFRRRIADPIVGLLVQGITPEKVALSVTIGVVIGILPVLGSGTILCTAAALGLRLNLVAMQAANWIAYPLQLGMLIPFFRVGAWLFREPPIQLAPGDLVAMFEADFWGSISALWTTTWQGCVAWLILAPFFSALLYAVLLPLLRRVPMRRKEAAAA
jgi:uncharacterized protein (DUF2062 family)